MTNFEARALSAAEHPEINTFALVMAEQPDGSGRRLEIQKALSFDEQDRQSGQDTYCVCTETGAAHYGGIRGWQLEQTRLTIAFDHAAELVFGTAEVSISFSEEHRDTLEAGLARLFEEDTGD